jgi:hypothetical protein
MSAISEKVRTALYAKLNVSGVTSLAEGGVYESQAPDTTTDAYVIFQRQAPGSVLYAFGTANAPTQVLEDDLWLIKAVVDEASDTSMSPQSLAEAILRACETALGSTLTLSGNTVLWMARFADMPPYQETLGDRSIFHRGFLLRIKTG